MHLAQLPDAAIPKTPAEKELVFAPAFAISRMPIHV
jgi:hypothetical protein